VQVSMKDAYETVRTIWLDAASSLRLRKERQVVSNAVALGYPGPERLNEASAELGHIAFPDGTALAPTLSPEASRAVLRVAGDLCSELEDLTKKRCKWLGSAGESYLTRAQGLARKRVVGEIQAARDNPNALLSEPAANAKEFLDQCASAVGFAAGFPGASKRLIGALEQWVKGDEAFSKETGGRLWHALRDLTTFLKCDPSADINPAHNLAAHALNVFSRTQTIQALSDAVTSLRLLEGRLMDTDEFRKLIKSLCDQEAKLFGGLCSNLKARQTSDSESDALRCAEPLDGAPAQQRLAWLSRLDPQARYFEQLLVADEDALAAKKRAVELGMGEPPSGDRLGALAELSQTHANLLGVLKEGANGGLLPGSVAETISDLDSSLMQLIELCRYYNTVDAAEVQKQVKRRTRGRRPEVPTAEPSARGAIEPPRLLALPGQSDPNLSHESSGPAAGT